MKKTLWALFFVLAVVKNSYAYTVMHEFDVFIGKFNASRTNFAYTLSEKDYAVNSVVRTYGTFGALYPFQAVYSTTGKILKDGEMQTQSYKYNAKSRFNTRTKELVYDEKGNPLFRLSSKNKKEKKAAVDQKLNSEGTTDLQTIIAELVKQYNQKRVCKSRLEVFDGKRRFDVVFEDEGQDVLKANKYSAFNGSAVKCSMYIDSLGNTGDDLLWELTLDKPVYFWIMEQNDTPFIARLEIEKTPYGDVKVYTRKLDIIKD